jgi:uncharacterized protein
MFLLIDGYNLLNATGITGEGRGPGGFQRSRLALLNFLADTLDPAVTGHTTIVFDSHGAPPGLPRGFEYREITVCFAVGYDSADAMIEELIRAASAPRQLTVVSSDHRIQRAARRRRAAAVDSETWYAETVRSHRQGTPPAAAPPAPLLEDDVLHWLERFGGESALQELIDKQEDDAANPFPPGYGDDLLNDE